MHLGLVNEWASFFYTFYVYKLALVLINWLCVCKFWFKEWMKDKQWCFNNVFSHSNVVTFSLSGRDYYLIFWNWITFTYSTFAVLWVNAGCSVGTEIQLIGSLWTGHNRITTFEPVNLGCTWAQALLKHLMTVQKCTVPVCGTSQGFDWYCMCLYFGAGWFSPCSDHSAAFPREIASDTYHCCRGNSG